MDLKFTMVMNEDVARKMTYIGQYYGHSRIKEIEWACKEYIKDFETKLGEIPLEKK